MFRKRNSISPDDIKISSRFKNINDQLLVDLTKKLHTPSYLVKPNEIKDSLRVELAKLTRSKLTKRFLQYFPPGLDSIEIIVEPRVDSNFLVAEINRFMQCVQNKTRFQVNPNTSLALSYDSSNSTTHVLRIRMDVVFALCLFRQPGAQLHPFSGNVGAVIQLALNNHVKYWSHKFRSKIQHITQHPVLSERLKMNTSYQIREVLIQYYDVAVDSLADNFKELTDSNIRSQSKRITCPPELAHKTFGLVYKVANGAHVGYLAKIKNEINLSAYTAMLTILVTYATNFDEYKEHLRGFFAQGKPVREMPPLTFDEQGIDAMYKDLRSQNGRYRTYKGFFELYEQCARKMGLSDGEMQITHKEMFVLLKTAQKTGEPVNEQYFVEDVAGATKQFSQMDYAGFLKRAGAKSQEDVAKINSDLRKNPFYMVRKCFLISRESSVKFLVKHQKNLRNPDDRIKILKKELLNPEGAREYVKHLHEVAEKLESQLPEHWMIPESIQLGVSMTVLILTTHADDFEAWKEDLKRFFIRGGTFEDMPKITLSKKAVMQTMREISLDDEKYSTISLHYGKLKDFKEFFTVYERAAKKLGLADNEMLVTRADVDELLNIAEQQNKNRIAERKAMREMARLQAIQKESIAQEEAERARREEERQRTAFMLKEAMRKKKTWTDVKKGGGPRGGISGSQTSRVNPPNQRRRGVK